MFSTETLITVAIAALLFSGIALYIAAQAVQTANAAMQYAQDCTEWMQKWNEKSQVLHKLAEFESEMTMHADLINALRDSMKKLRSRIHMRNLNSGGKTTPDGFPDPDKDPEGWKKAMNAALMQTGE